MSAGNDLLLIKSDESLVKKGFASEFYLPYVDFYVKSVELGAKDSEKSADLQSTNLKGANSKHTDLKGTNLNAGKIEAQNALMLLESL